ncbi:MAG: hypothetical protein QM742_15075 [Aquabacterium sp.]
MSTAISWQHQTLPRPVPRRVLAFGAWLKNTACRLDGDQVTWSPLHGDLAEPAQCEALEASAEALAALGEVDVIVHDLHPDFFSTRLAQAWSERLGVPAIGVQHHHAHIAALQAEHGIAGPLLGLALDGVGLGTDGTAWGGEGLWVDAAQWQRLGHLTPLHLPGGDVAAREPWRMAAAACHLLGRPLSASTLPGITGGCRHAWHSGAHAGQGPQLPGDHQRWPLVRCGRRRIGPGTPAGLRSRSGHRP